MTKKQKALPFGEELFCVSGRVDDMIYEVGKSLIKPKNPAVRPAFIRTVYIWTGGSFFLSRIGSTLSAIR